MMQYDTTTNESVLARLIFTIFGTDIVRLGLDLKPGETTAMAPWFSTCWLEWWYGVRWRWHDFFIL